MQPADFQFIADWLKKRSGLALTEDKIYLLDSRLLPVARNHGCDSVTALIHLVRTSRNDAVLREVTEAMTTNESLFFRDSKPFDYLRQTILPAYKAAGGRSSTRIWSAACSTGQEPYSIAMSLLEEEAKMPGWKYEIVATDLAQKVLDRARAGIFSQFEVQRGLPIQMLIKYFAQLPANMWQIKEPLRAMVSYRMQNLLEGFAILGKFDIIFCRNVLIYFDEATKAQVVDSLANALLPGGYLALGCSEALMDKTQRFSAVTQCSGLYRLK